MKVVAVLILGMLALANAEVYFSEDFSGDWESRWVHSKSKESEGTQGKFDVTHGKYYNDAEADKGLHTTTDARFYQLTAEIPKSFSNKDKDLIIQYSVKHEQNIDCGGGYIKLHPSGINQETYNGDSVYNIMFGPDICGHTKKSHVIFTHDGKNYLTKKEAKCESDDLTHLYTLIVSPDNTYKVLIDSKEVSSGSLKTDFDILPPKEIKDPSAKKPADWVDAKTIADPEDKKPEGWDDIPAEIPEPDAKKPEDWDDELDGEWEAPMIDNPEYKGEWSPKMIPNPEYKGEWVHPMIPNPDYKDNDELYLYTDNKFVGFELWQVKAGTIFDNILITDDQSTADEWAKKTQATQEGEKKMKNEADEISRKAAEAAQAADEVDEADMAEDKDEL